MSRTLAGYARISRTTRTRVSRVMRAMLSLMVAASVVPLAFAPATAVAAGAVTTSHLYCVDFVDANTGYAAGADGTVVKTTNGGTSWTVVRTGDAHEFRGIGFTDANNGWIMSRAGVGLKTADGGATWTSLTADIGGDFYVGENVYAMARLGVQEAVAVGGINGKPGVGFHKYGGVNSWLSNNFPELMAGTYDPAPELPPHPKDGLGEFYGVDFVTSARGWAVGHDRFTGVTPDANAPIIWDFDSTRGFTDKWTQQPVTGTGPLYDVAFASTTQGVAVGSAGKTYRTSNAGGTWTAGTAGSADLLGVELTTSGQGWAVGNGGVIYRSTDNGANWSPLTSPTGYQLEDIDWVAGDTAFAVGDAGTIVRTTNGTSWAMSNTGGGTPSDPPVMNTLTSSSHPSETTWVKSTSVSAAWTATAGSSAIAGYGVLIDASASTAPSAITHAASPAALTATGSGKWYIHARARDTGGAWSNTLHRAVWVDVTVPTATFSPNASGYAGSASVPLTATDSHSGVASVSYKIDGGSTTTVNGSSTNVVLSTPGTYDVTYWATDNVNNVVGQVTKQVTVTANPPVMNTLTSSSHPSESTWVKSTSVSAAWTATAGDLAIEGYGVTIDAVQATVPSTITHAVSPAALTATGSGKWWVHARAKDAGGNWSNTLHRAVWVDVTAPTATFSPNASGYAGSASVPLTATDSHSGVASVSYKIDSEPTITINGSSTNIVISTPGTYDVTYWATDNVNNVVGQVTKQVTVTESLVPEAQPVSGAGRYATAIESAKLHFTTPMAAGPDGEKWVVIASGTNWPDALAASGLAGALEAPLLLTTPDDLRGEVATYITQLGATRAAIVGGEAAVSSGVAADLAGLVGGSANVERYGAGSRYATAELIATKTVGVGSRAAWDHVAFLSTGGNFPDALAAAPLSAAKGRPLYLALPKTGVSDATIAAMKANGVQRVIVLGGSNAVPDSSIARLQAAGITVGAGDRWNGTDRYDTGRVVAEKSLLEGLSPEFSGLATGENFPDALAGGVAQGLSGSVLVLTQSSVLSAPARTYFTTHKGQIAEIRFFGGTSALAGSVRTAALDAATP